MCAVVAIVAIFTNNLSNNGLYRIEKDSAFSSMPPIKKNAITLNSCVEKEANIGEVFLGQSIQKALSINYPEITIDYVPLIDKEIKTLVSEIRDTYNIEYQIEISKQITGLLKLKREIL